MLTFAGIGASNGGSTAAIGCRAHRYTGNTSAECLRFGVASTSNHSAQSKHSKQNDRHMVSTTLDVPVAPYDHQDTNDGGQHCRHQTPV